MARNERSAIWEGTKRLTEHIDELGDHSERPHDRGQHPDCIANVFEYGNADEHRNPDEYIDPFSVRHEYRDGDAIADSNLRSSDHFV